MNLVWFFTVLLTATITLAMSPPHLESRQLQKPKPTPVRQTIVKAPQPKPTPVRQTIVKAPQPKPTPVRQTIVKAPQPSQLNYKVAAGQILFCGKQPYRPSQYTCYPKNNNLLCPILHGVAYKPCGNYHPPKSGACYDPDNYDCVNGQLILSNTCGGVLFDTNLYVCIQKQLCPKTHANRCGAHCYHTSAYYCDKGVLKQKGRK